MATKWTAARIEQLFLLMVDDLKPNYEQLAQKWKKVYPNDTFHPTGRAISEKFGALKKRMSNGGQSATADTPTTPRRTGQGDTPHGSQHNRGSLSASTGRKRVRWSSRMSDEDDTEDEDGMDLAGASMKKRKTASRRGRTTTSYREDNSEDESNDSESKVPNGKSDQIHDMSKAVISSKKTARTSAALPGPEESDHEDDSDTSAWNPFG